MAVRRYEMLVMIDVGIPEEKLEQVIAKLEETITSSDGGEILTLDRWGKKRLAYEIQKKQFGYYVLFEFLADAKIPSELDRFCRLDTGVMRHLILHIPEKVIKLKEKEEQIKVALEERRKAASEAADEELVEDMLDAPQTESDSDGDSKKEEGDDEKKGDGENAETEGEAEEKAEKEADEKKADDDAGDKAEEKAQAEEKE